MDITGGPGGGDGSVVQVGDWTGRLPDDRDAATRRHRRAQGLWRSEVLKWPAGPPTAPRTRARYPTLPNYLAEKHDGITAEDSGVNLMSTDARTYTKTRLPVIESLAGTALRDRLYRNVLSSQPLAFSVAGELRAHPAAAAAVFRDLTGQPVTGLATLTGVDSCVPENRRRRRGYRPLETYALDGIEAEWFPPRWAHTDDQSGFDIAACLTLEDHRRLLVSVEVKYTDKFSRKPIVWDRYAAHLEALGLDQASTAALVKSGCSQVLRQVMITDSVRRIGLVPDVDDAGRVDAAVAVVLGRGDDEKARDVAAALDDCVTMPVLFRSHEQLFDAAHAQTALRSWAKVMRERYLPTC